MSKELEAGLNKLRTSNNPGKKILNTFQIEVNKEQVQLVSIDDLYLP